MATTVTRSHWTDDSGVPGAPVGNGTQINESELQKIYANIDALVGGNVTFGGNVGSEAAGTHLFSASGANNRFNVRNTSTANGAFASFTLGNNGAQVMADFALFSTTTSTAGYQRPDGAVVVCAGAGGLQLAASNAAGQMGFFVGSSTAEKLRIYTTGVVISPDSSDLTNRAQGLTIAHASTTHLAFFNGAGAANQKWWRWACTGDALILRTLDDAGVATGTFYVFTRSGVTPLEAQWGCDHVTGGGDGTHKIGTSANRWAEVNSVIVQSGDLVLDNMWSLTESTKIDCDEEGVAILDPDGNVVAFFGKGGMVPLDQLTYTRTTLEQRRLKSLRRD